MSSLALIFAGGFLVGSVISKYVWNPSHDSPPPPPPPPPLPSVTITLPHSTVSILELIKTKHDLHNNSSRNGYLVETPILRNSILLRARNKLKTVSEEEQTHKIIPSSSSPLFDELLEYVKNKKETNIE
jgi:hypothetical protein